MLQCTAEFTAIFVSLCAGMLAAAEPKPAPEIYSLVPNTGPAGQAIALRGAELQAARHIYFCAGRIVREAKFKVISAGELQVTAPPFFHPGVAATVVVQTAYGATIGIPASVLKVDRVLPQGQNAAAFLHVVDGGVVSASRGLLLVEDGGTAKATYASGICCVKDGGTISNLDHYFGLLFYESKAILQTSRDVLPINPAVRLIQVRQVTGSAGVDPYIYQTPDRPGDAARAAPHVNSVRPAQAKVGELLTLDGSGFLETTEVSVIGDRDFLGNKLAAFRIVSDSQLEIDLPEATRGYLLLTISNPKGTTVAVSRDEFDGNNRKDRPIDGPLEVVKAKIIIENGTGSRGYFIEKGATVADNCAGYVFFVNKGGRMFLRGDRGGHGQSVFYESGADIVRAAQNGGRHTLHEVESLSMSVVASPLEILGP